LSTSNSISDSTLNDIDSVLGGGPLTVCVAVCVHDGIVAAADSAAAMISTNESGQSVATNVYRHGNKVFNLYRGLPVFAMAAGMASIGNSGIHTLAKDLRKKLNSDGEYAVDQKNYTIEAIAQYARKFLFDEQYSKAPIPPPHALEFWIGGYSAGSDLPELWKVSILNGLCDKPSVLSPPGESGIFWGGQPEPINRLLFGFDASLEQALAGAGMDATEIPKLIGMVRASSARYLSDPRMPIQDAIDLAQYLVDVTKGYYRFLPGADTVGGDTDVAVVTRHERFKWVKRKHFYPAHLNMETDHDHG
jgi:hypothetical protein